MPKGCQQPNLAQEWVSKTFDLVHVATEDNFADVLTKALPRATFRGFVDSPNKGYRQGDRSILGKEVMGQACQTMSQLTTLGIYVMLSNFLHPQDERIGCQQNKFIEGIKAPF